MNPRVSNGYSQFSVLLPLQQELAQMPLTRRRRMSTMEKVSHVPHPRWKNSGDYDDCDLLVCTSWIQTLLQIFLPHQRINTRQLAHHSGWGVHHGAREPHDYVHLLHLRGEKIAK